MPRTPRIKLARSEKQKAADKKNLADWEAKQAEEARVSNDKIVADIAYKEGYDKGHITGLVEGEERGRDLGYTNGFIRGFEEKKQLRYVNMLSGFVLGSVTVLIATSIALGLMSNIGRP